MIQKVLPPAKFVRKHIDIRNRKNHEESSQTNGIKAIHVSTRNTN
jgi:hypothetical protein